jgi:hypothetical protein
VGSDRLSYKDIQAFVGADGKPSAPKLVATTPQIFVDAAPGQNQTQLRTRTGAGAIGLGPSNSVVFAGVQVTGLTALELVVTDASENLTTVPFVGTGNVLHDGNPPTFGKVVEGDQSLSDVNTWNATTSAHGYLTKLPGGTTVFLNGNGVFTTVTSGAASGYQAVAFSNQTSVNVVHNQNGYPLVQIIGTSNSYVVTHNSLNDFTATFDVSSSGFILWSLGSPGIPSIAVKTINYTLTSSDNTIVSNGAITLTLPTAVGIDGRLYRIKRIYGGGYTTITTTGSQTIDTLPPPLILTSQYDVVDLIASGGNWFLF